jgi:tripartite-type tricarboxylate transporter receptor subunit TctC
MGSGPEGSRGQRETSVATPRVVSFFAVLALAGVWFGAAPVQAGAYPDRPIRLIVPYPPGGGIDPSARILAESLSKTLGQALYVDNHAGASGRIGTGIAAHAAPDGYTLLYGSVAPNVILPAAYGDKAGYRQEKDFIPIALVAQADYVLLVSSWLPVNSIKELIDYARRNPQRVTYASSGLLSGPHLAGELLGKLAGVELTHVPYRGNGPALTAVMTGEVSMAFDSAGGAVANGKSDAYKVLAVTGGPLAAYPYAPDLGAIYPGHDVSQWYGLFATSGTSPDIVARLEAAVHDAVNTDFVRQRFAQIGLRSILDSTSASFGSYVDNEIARWRKIIITNEIPVPPI